MFKVLEIERGKYIKMYKMEDVRTSQISKDREGKSLGGINTASNILIASFGHQTTDLKREREGDGRNKGIE